MEHFQHIDIMQPGVLVRVILAAYAWVLDRDLWVWVCASGAAANFLGVAFLVTFVRRGAPWLSPLFRAGQWSAAALLFAERGPAMRWLEQPTFPSLPWQASLALFVVQWLFGMAVLTITVASLFGWSTHGRER